jgi:hypothetical protein
VIADDRLNVPSGVSPNDMIWIAMTISSRPSWPSGEKQSAPYREEQQSKKREQHAE